MGGENSEGPPCFRDGRAAPRLLTEESGSRGLNIVGRKRGGEGADSPLLLQAQKEVTERGKRSLLPDREEGKKKKNEGRTYWSGLIEGKFEKGGQNTSSPSPMRKEREEKKGEGGKQRRAHPDLSAGDQDHQRKIKNRDLEWKRWEKGEEKKGSAWNELQVWCPFWRPGGERRSDQQGVRREKREKEKKKRKRSRGCSGCYHSPSPLTRRDLGRGKRSIGPSSEIIAKGEEKKKGLHLLLRG